MTRVAALTPAGTGAIATLAVVGAGAWDAVRTRFRPAGGMALPDVPPVPRFWFGTLGEGVGDEVVVAAKRVEPEPWVEVHCHGGRHVVRWLVDQFRQLGCTEVAWQELLAESAKDPAAVDVRAVEPLTRASTVRTAAVLLDQYRGAFARAVAATLTNLDRGDVPAATGRLTDLARLAPVGRHLVAPWHVVIAGPPNVGKSSLVNALAGYQRSVVAPVAGTTRDVVTVAVAFDGWPVELADTAGLRESAEELEAAGVGRARNRLAAADLVVWVLDATDPAPVYPGPDLPPVPVRLVANKTDLPPAWDVAASEAFPVSAATGAGVAELVADLAARLAPDPPAAGAAVPFTPLLAEQTERAYRSLTAGDVAGARVALAGRVY